MKSLILATVLILSGILTANPAKSAVLFSDNFENDVITGSGTGQTLNWKALKGDIQVALGASYNLNGPTSKGLLLRNERRSRNSSAGNLSLEGIAESLQTINFVAGRQYTMTFDFAQVTGFNRSDHTLFYPNSFGGIAYQSFSARRPTDPIQLISQQYSWIHDPVGPSKLLFWQKAYNTSGNLGSGFSNTLFTYIDNIVISDNLPDAVAVPEPEGIAGLLLFGAAALILKKRMNKALQK